MTRREKSSWSIRRRKTFWARSAANWRAAPLDAILRTREETTLLDCTGENLSTSRPNVLANILVRDDQNKKPGLTLILKDKTEAVRKAEQLNGTQHIVTALRPTTTSL